ncbi:hypothetical protein DL89DRAFT_141882 [Linderina pennispora]|uniref:Uncharacterized protein n=1 Tax=Linderina pennispora TaxID=61395 RepID=A0A1Y1WBZ9_9FUNG|nr:uncharacterized protein DL89DRAFT_141882 [Linderina pennispora]ORX70848.1 hypothetical protein DL89DRAFT_141882 [Linderina pennispora]
MCRAHQLLRMQNDKRLFDIFVKAFTVCSDHQLLVPEFTSFVEAFGLTDAQHTRVAELTRVERSGSSREGFVLALGALARDHSFAVLCELITDGLLDCTVDNRGDVGSWVRKECLTTLNQIFASDASALAQLSDNDLVTRLFARPLQAATERIDKLRAAAGELIETLLASLQ